MTSTSMQGQEEHVQSHPELPFRGGDSLGIAVVYWNGRKICPPNILHIPSLFSWFSEVSEIWKICRRNWSLNELAIFL
jgi:hypothetical protein